MPCAHSAFICLEHKDKHARFIDASVRVPTSVCIFPRTSISLSLSIVSSCLFLCTQTSKNGPRPSVISVFALQSWGTIVFVVEVLLCGTSALSGHSVSPGISLVSMTSLNLISSPMNNVIVRVSYCNPQILPNVNACTCILR